MLTQDQIKALQAPFPPEALSADTSRGFELTSIKAAFVIERLNEVFGLCGTGWRFVHNPFEEVHGEIVSEVALQYRTDTGCAPIMWDTQANGWAYHNTLSSEWSEPIFASGGKSVGKGGAPYTDARKSAVTDGLTKAASMLGVGADVFKGLVRVGNNGRVRTSIKPDATRFWTLYNAQGKAVGVPIEAAQGLADNGDWEAAIQELQTLIAGARA